MKPRYILSDITPYEPGKPIEEVQRELGLKDVIKMASNENALGPSPRALKAMAEALPGLHRYPDGNGTLLRQDLAKFYEVIPEQVIVGNGSDELLQLIALAYLDASDTVITSQCTFSEYEFCAKLMAVGINLVPLKDFTYDLDAIANAITDMTKLIFISNPNNPTGTYVNHEQLAKFMESVPRHVLVVLDEAYAEFVRASDYPKAIKLLTKFPNLIILRTFSKIYGLAGLRIGYGISSEIVIKTLNKVKQPFNVNTLAQIAARAALQDQDHVQKTQKLVREQIALLENGLRQVGCTPVPSQGNFVFARTPIAGRYIFQQLLQHGVIIRPMDSFGESHAIRVTISTLPEMGKLLGLLPKIFKQQ